jgi:hypothetical protein
MQFVGAHLRVRPQDLSSTWNQEVICGERYVSTESFIRQDRSPDARHASWLHPCDAADSHSGQSSVLLAQNLSNVAIPTG